jgi:hypothetical protein
LGLGSQGWGCGWGSSGEVVDLECAAACVLVLLEGEHLVRGRGRGKVIGLGLGLACCSPWGRAPLVRYPYP